MAFNIDDYTFGEHQKKSLGLLDTRPQPETQPTQPTEPSPKFDISNYTFPGQETAAEDQPGFLKETGKAFVRGAGGIASGLVGPLVQLAGVEDTGKAIQEAGVKLEEMAPMSKQWQESFVKRGVAGGVESMPSSVAAGVPGAAIGSFGGPLGAYLGYALSGGSLMGMAEYQNFLNEYEKEFGKTPDSRIKAHAALSGLAEGGFEFLSDLLGGRAIFGKWLDAPKKSLKELIRKPLKEHLKAAGTVMSAEVPTEIATAGVESWARQQSGIDTFVPGEAMKEAAIPAAVMSMLFFGGGTGLQALRSRRIESSLINKDADPAQRLRAANDVNQSILSSFVDNATGKVSDIGKETSAEWMKYAGNMINAGLPISMDSQMDLTALRIENQMMEMPEEFHIVTHGNTPEDIKKNTTPEPPLGVPVGTPYGPDILRPVPQQRPEEPITTTGYGIERLPESYQPTIPLLPALQGFTMRDVDYGVPVGAPITEESPLIAEAERRRREGPSIIDAEHEATERLGIPEAHREKQRALPAGRGFGLVEERTETQNRIANLQNRLGKITGFLADNEARLTPEQKDRINALISKDRAELNALEKKEAKEQKKAAKAAPVVPEALTAPVTVAPAATGLGMVSTTTPETAAQPVVEKPSAPAAPRTTEKPEQAGLIMPQPVVEETAAATTPPAAPQPVVEKKAKAAAKAAEKIPETPSAPAAPEVPTAKAAPASEVPTVLKGRQSKIESFRKLAKQGHARYKDVNKLVNDVEDEAYGKYPAETTAQIEANKKLAATIDDFRKVQDEGGDEKAAGKKFTKVLDDYIKESKLIEEGIAIKKSEEANKKAVSSKAKPEPVSLAKLPKSAGEYIRQQGYDFPEEVEKKAGNLKQEFDQRNPAAEKTFHELAKEYLTLKQGAIKDAREKSREAGAKGKGYKLSVSRPSGRVEPVFVRRARHRQYVANASAGIAAQYNRQVASGGKVTIPVETARQINEGIANPASGLGLSVVEDAYDKPEYSVWLQLAQNHGFNDLVLYHDSSDSLGGFVGPGGIMFLNVTSQKSQHPIHRILGHEISHMVKEGDNGNEAVQARINIRSGSFLNYINAYQSVIGALPKTSEGKQRPYASIDEVPSATYMHIMEEYACDLQGGMTENFNVDLYDGLFGDSRVYTYEDEFFNLMTGKRYEATKEGTRQKGQGIRFYINPMKVVRALRTKFKPETWEEVLNYARTRNITRDPKPDTIEGIMYDLGQVPEPNDIAAVALMGEPASWWYVDDANTFNEWFGKRNELFTGLLSAFSVMSPVETVNLKDAITVYSKIMKAEKAQERELTQEEIMGIIGKYKTLTAKKEEAVNVALGKFLQPQKTRAFHAALQGLQLGVVLDRWMARMTGLLNFKFGVSSEDFIRDDILYEAIGKRITDAGKIIGKKPNETQVAIWGFTKALWNRMGQPQYFKGTPVGEAIKEIRNRDIAMAQNYALAIADEFRKPGSKIIKLLNQIGITNEQIKALPLVDDMLIRRGIDPFEQPFKRLPAEVQESIMRVGQKVQDSWDIRESMNEIRVAVRRIKADEKTPLNMALETASGVYANMPWEKKLELHNELRVTAFSDKNLKKLAKRYGLNLEFVVDGPGTWYNEATKEVQVNPNFTINLSTNEKPSPELSRRIRAFAALLGAANYQDAVGFTNLTTVGELFKEGPALAVHLGKTVDPARSIQLSNELGSFFTDVEYGVPFIVPTKDGLIVTMPKLGKEYPYDTAYFTDNTMRMLDKVFGDDIQETLAYDKSAMEGGDYYEATGNEGAGTDNKGKPIVPSFKDAIRNQRGPRGEQELRDLHATVDRIRQDYQDEIYREAAESGFIGEQWAESGGYQFSVNQARRVGRQPRGAAATGFPYGIRAFESEAKRQRIIKRVGMSAEKLEEVRQALLKDPAAGALPQFKNKEAIFTHWSNTSGISTTDPSRHGYGAMGQERKARESYPELFMPRTYMAYGKYKKEPGIGNYMYAMKIDGNRVYDREKDPLDLFPYPEQTRKLDYYDALSQSLIYDCRIIQAGFSGDVVHDANVITVFEPVDVVEVKDIGKPLGQDYKFSITPTDTGSEEADEYKLSIIPQAVMENVFNPVRDRYINPETATKEDIDKISHTAQSIAANKNKYIRQILDLPYQMAKIDKNLLLVDGSIRNVHLCVKNILPQDVVDRHCWPC